MTTPDQERTIEADAAERAVHDACHQHVIQFARGVAHELNNLSQSLGIACEMTRQSLEQAHPARSYVDLMFSACDRIRTMTSDLRTYANLRHVEPMSLDVNPQLRSAIAQVEKDHPSAKIQFDPPAGEVVAHMDPTHLAAAVRSMLLNAIEAAPRETVQVATESTVTEFLGQSRQAAKISVRDHGPGFSQSVMDQMFDPFYSTKGKGRGLGLSMVQSVLMFGRGKLHVTTSGDGSDFQLFFQRDAVPN